MTSPILNPVSDVERFRVKEVLPATEQDKTSQVVAASLGTQAVLEWCEDTPLNRKKKVELALDDGKSVETHKTRYGKQLLVISGIEGLPEGKRVIIDGKKPVRGMDGDEVPAVELLVPDDIIEIHPDGAINLMGLAEG